MIYFIRSGDFVKVGLSEKPWKRLSDLQTAHHDHLEMLAVMPGDRTTEQDLHRRFSEYRHNREWFRSSKLLMEFIEQARSNHPDLQEAPGVAPKAKKEEVVKVRQKYEGETINKACSWFDKFYQSGGQIEFYDYPDKFIIGLPGSTYTPGYDPRFLYSLSYDDGSMTPKIGQEKLWRTLTDRLNTAMMAIVSFYDPVLAEREDYGVFLRFDKEPTSDP